MAATSYSVTSVQQLATEPINSIPQHFLRPDQEPPSPFFNENTGPLPTIPIIDMKQLLSGEASAEFELENLYSSCKEWGLFQVVNHGVSISLLENLKHEIEGFFQLPLEEKMKYKKEGDFEGYGTVILSNDQKLDWGDRFYMITNPLNRRKPHLFPELPSSLRITLESYIMELQKLAMTLLGFLGKGVKMDVNEIGELFEDGMQSVRMTYYPPCPQPEQVMGITAHSDATGITILNQVNGVNGLELKKDGVWIPVNVKANALVVNLGDILEILSNGKYKSVEHRVSVNSKKERISIATFFNPKFESEIGPMMKLTSPQNPPLYKRIQMEKYVKDFFSRRLDGKSYLELMRIKTEEQTANIYSTT
ncbi:2-oxoglutarate (2OG) and Fe(II)-dependent oxygenase superfamily protein [Quillaja saponaria]|uniref:2-oxoglutarate (2OG) and Fe(II)-dependent oxygenase superfamily protein n=1 Tax=Quillaja saponaria TaxID=32244 RepID=A0AAD7PVI6_QUISA|nr:2-oxoglutarate (2OG) and Fe(II)-dependent oxygenase superfamily protein [Quillaja saponaria]